MSVQTENAKLNAIKQLVELQQSNDPEAAHVMADQCLCALLTELGMSDVVVEFEKIHRYYQ